MMQIERLERVIQFLLTKKGKCIYQTADWDIFFEGMFIKKSNAPTELNSFFEKIYLHDWEGNYYIYSEDGSLYEHGKSSAYYHISDEHLGKQFVENNKLYESVINSSMETIFCIEFNKYNNSNCLTDSTFSLLNSLSKISTFSIVNESLKWQLDISDSYKLQLELGGEKKGEVSQFIGVYNNLLWVLLNGGRFIGIDLRSGDVKHCIKDTQHEHVYGSIEFLRGYRSPTSASFCHLDRLKGKIITESIGGIWEINLTADHPHLEVWGLSDQYERYGLKSIGHKTVLLGTDLCFIDYNALKWGIIDLEAKKVKWVSEKITEAKTQLKEIQCGGSKVYVLDGSKTLHIFERQ